MQIDVSTTNELRDIFAGAPKSVRLIIDVDGKPVAATASVEIQPGEQPGSTQAVVLSLRSA